MQSPGLALFNRAKLEDLFWFALNELLLPFSLSFLAVHLGWSLLHAPERDYSDSFLLELPIALQVITFLIVFDFLSYWSHRLFHSIPFLWELHKLHHSTTHLTALSAFRKSGFETVLIAIYQNLLVNRMPISRQAFWIANIATLSTCIVQHADLRWKIPKFIEKALITPRNHAWHHSARCYRTHGQNFGFFLTLWDRIFGTHYLPERGETRVGLDDPSFPKTIFGRTLYPVFFSK